MTTELSTEVISAAQPFMPLMSIEQATQRREALVHYVKALMKEGTDYGKIPGTDKDTLLKPGAEKLCTLFGLTASFTVVEKELDWRGGNHDGEPFFYFQYRCQLRRGELLMGEGEGSCNSWESKYRWRWASAQDVPAHLDIARLATRGGKVSEFTFAIDKAETGGKYGKPAAYWQSFKDGIDNGTARSVKKKTAAGKEFDAWEIDSIVYRVPNPDPADVVNTVQKMSQKRALIAACLIAVNASEFFTQDIEDFTHAEPAPVQQPQAQREDVQEAEWREEGVQQPRLMLAEDINSTIREVKHLVMKIKELGGTPTKNAKPIKDMSYEEAGMYLDSLRHLQRLMLTSPISTEEDVETPTSELEQEAFDRYAEAAL